MSGKGESLVPDKGSVARHHTWSAEEATYCFEGDGETQSEKEDTIDERGKDFSAMPAVRVASVRRALRRQLEKRNEE